MGTSLSSRHAYWGLVYHLGMLVGIILIGFILIIFVGIILTELGRSAHCEWQRSLVGLWTVKRKEKVSRAQTFIPFSILLDGTPSCLPCYQLPQASAAAASLLWWTATSRCELKQTLSPLSCFHWNILSQGKKITTAALPV